MSCRGSQRSSSAMEMRAGAKQLRSSSQGMDKKSIEELKEFYLQRLAKTSNGDHHSLLGPAADAGSSRRPSADGRRPYTQSSTNSAMSARQQKQDADDIEVMCNNCCNLIKASEAPFHDCTQATGRQPICSTVVAEVAPADAASMPTAALALLDLKLRKLREALESKLADAISQVHVMRHLTQLRYHIDTALKWQEGGPGLGICNHTMQQLKQLTSMARVFDPSMYVFSKRIESIVCQKERELRKGLPQSSSAATPSGSSFRSPTASTSRLLSPMLLMDKTMSSLTRSPNGSVIDADSDCGTFQGADTVVTQDQVLTGDVGNLKEANEALSSKSEDEQRRWFYSQCLTVKLSIPDKMKAKRILISDLYSRVRSSGISPDKWGDWMRAEVQSELSEAPAEVSSTTHSKAATPVIDMHFGSDSGGTGGPPAKVSSPTSKHLPSPSSSTGGPGLPFKLNQQCNQPPLKQQQDQQPSLQTSAMALPTRRPLLKEPARQLSGGSEVSSSRGANPPQVVWAPRTAQASTTLQRTHQAKFP